MAKVLLAPLTPVSISQDHEDYLAYRGRSKKPPPKPSATVEDNPELAEHVRAVLHDAGHALSVVEIAKRVAARMGAELSHAALLFPTHPSRMAIAAVIKSWSAAEIEAIFGQPRVLPADPPPGQINAPTMTYLESNL